MGSSGTFFLDRREWQHRQSRASVYLIHPWKPTRFYAFWHLQELPPEDQTFRLSAVRSVFVGRVCRCDFLVVVALEWTYGRRWPRRAKTVWCFTCCWHQVFHVAERQVICFYDEVRALVAQRYEFFKGWVAIQLSMSWKKKNLRTSVFIAMTICRTILTWSYSFKIIVGLQLSYQFATQHVQHVQPTHQRR